jgi:GT2 family glycosyltransferase
MANKMEPSDLAEPEVSASAPPVSIIIVSYNTRDYLRRCLTTLYDDPPELVREVIVVDNDSADGSVDMVREEFPQARVIANRANLGYAKAVNQGMRETSGSYFLILNPDIETSADSIGALWRFMESSPGAGIAGAKLLNPDGSLQMSCRTFYTIPVVLLRRTFLGKLFPNSRLVRNHLMQDWNHDSDREVDWVTGACMMVRREAYESIGGMDERFFLYFEDVDWCYRMSRHGWKVCYVHSSVMKHAYRRESARLLPDRKLMSHLLSTFRFYDKWSSAMHSLKRERRVLSVIGTILSDIILLNVSFVLAYYIRYVISASATSGFLAKPLYPLAMYRDLMILITFVCLFSFLYSGLYRRVRRASFVRDLITVARAVLLSSLVIMAVTYLTRNIAYSRFIVLLSWPISAVLVSAGRALQRSIHGGLRRSLFDLRRVAVVGVNERAAEIAGRILDAGEGYDFVGYIAPPDREPSAQVKPLIGTSEEIRDIVNRHRIHDILVCDRELSRHDVGSIVILGRSCGAEVKVVSEVTDMLIRGSQLDEVAGIPVAVFPPSSLTGTRLVAKILSDLVFSFVGLVSLLALTPLILIFQTITRRNYRVWAGALKDLWLVLVGKRSLVGPSRPIEGERIRPGVTGLWLLTGREPGEKQEDRLDMYYLQNWTVSGDLEIILVSLKGLPRLFGLSR